METDKPDDVHVMPMYGSEHEDSANCKCSPKLEKDSKRTDRARVWVHREDN